MSQRTCSERLEVLRSDETAEVVMPPSSARDFQKAASQRLTTAEFLLTNKYTLDAMYLIGYGVECTLKALILAATPLVEQPETLAKITKGGKWHGFEILAGFLKDLGCPVPPGLKRRLQKSRWSTDLRYEYHRRDYGEVRGFLRTAKETFDWVKGQLP